MKKNLDTHIDFLILGALGQMGKVAQDSLPQTIKELKNHDLYVRSVNLVDPGYRDIERQTDTCLQSDAIQVRKFSALSDALHFLLARTTASQARTFMYDASPTPYHFGHLALLTQFYPENTCYVGEKPIVIMQDQLAMLQHTTRPYIYCNFSETMSDVSRRLIEELAGKHILSTHIARISSVAKKKAHGLDRNGVTGGALFDKGVHALAFTIHMLGVEKIANYEITQSQVESLCPDVKIHPTAYLDGMNTWDKKKISCELNPFDWSVDGAINAMIKWRVLDGKSNARQVQSRYYFSWLGTERLNGFADFQKHMTDLGFEDREWRLDVDLSKKAGVNLVDEHVRCSIIETEKNFYVCNFLSSANPENDAALWKIEKGSSNRRRIFPVNSGNGSIFNKVREGKTNRVFVKSILDWYGVRRAPNLDRSITILAHDVLVKLRDIAYRDQVA